jgi:hypothetical protein
MLVSQSWRLAQGHTEKRVKTSIAQLAVTTKAKFISPCVCMYVYVCVYVCVHVYVYVCECMCICVYICVCMYMCICVCTYVYVCIRVCVCVYGYICVCMYMYRCMCICLCVCVCVWKMEKSIEVQLATLGSSKVVAWRVFSCTSNTDVTWVQRRPHSATCDVGLKEDPQSERFYP